MSEPVMPPSRPPGAPPPPSAGRASDNRTIMIVLSYLYILALVPLLVEKDDSEVQWHAKHGLVLLALEIIIGVGLFVLTAISSLIPVLGCLSLILYIPAMLIWLALFIVRIICIVKGVAGERFLVPYVSKYADSF